MLDVSFSELVMILIVGLLVFGPEKLPEVVRTASLWIGKLRRSFTQIRNEIEREVGIDEIKREIHNQSILDSLKDVRDDLHKAHQNLRDLPYDVKDVVERANATVEPVKFDPVPDDDFRHNAAQANAIAPLDDPVGPQPAIHSATPKSTTSPSS